MIIENVKLRDLDRSETDKPPYYRSRIVDITTDKGTFSTPARPNTRTEYVARSETPLSECLPLDLAVDFRDLNDELVTGLLDDPKIGNELVALTNQFNDITRRTKFRFSVFQPSKTLLGNMEPKNRIKFADMQANYLQIKLGSNLVTYPFLNLPSNEYKEFIKSRYQNNSEFSTIFTLDLAMEPKHLQEILNYLINVGDPIIINIIYRDWQKTIPQHEIINSYFDREQVAFFACQVPREDLISHTSNLHAVAFGSGFDLVALNQSRGYSDNEDLDLSKIKFFDPITLGINNIEDTLLDESRNVANEFQFTEDNFRDLAYVQKILTGFQGAKVHLLKYQILYYLARVHEAMTSPRIFDESRSRIKSKEILSYIEETNLRNVPLIKNRR